MQAVIGNSLVNSLKPAEKPYEVRDTQLKGLLLRVQPTGVMTFYVEYARAKRLRLGRAGALTPAQAREQAKATLAEAYQGGDPAAARRQARAHSFRSFVDEVYGPWAEGNIRTAKATVTRLRSNFPDFQTKKLTDITPWLVEKWRLARLKSGVKVSTVNRDLDDLKSSLNKATQWGLVESNPIGTVKRSRVDTSPRVRFLKPDEGTRLLLALDAREERILRERESANEWRRARGYAPLPDLRDSAFADRLKPMVLLSLHTGLRQGEVFSLTWSNVDLEHEILTVGGEVAKGGRTRHVPLNSEAIAVLLEWRAQAADIDDWVFPGKGGRLNNVRRSWTGVLKDAGISGFRWHDLRHTFASRLVMAGVDLNTVRELLGHSTYQMTLRYAHLAPEHKAAAVARLVERVEPAVMPMEGGATR